MYCSQDPAITCKTENDNFHKSFEQVFKVMKFGNEIIYSSKMASIGSSDIKWSKIILLNTYFIHMRQKNNWEITFFGITALESLEYILKETTNSRIHSQNKYLFFSEALIDDINIDIQQATASMDQEKFKIFSENALFKEVTDSQKL